MQAHYETEHPKLNEELARDSAGRANVAPTIGEYQPAIGEYQLVFVLLSGVLLSVVCDYYYLLCEKQ